MVGIGVASVGCSGITRCWNVEGRRMKAPSQGGLQYVMYNVGAVRLCPKGDPKGLGCSTPKRKRAFDNLVIQKRTGSDLCTTRWMGRE